MINARNAFNPNTNTGFERISGLTLALVSWWVDTRNGLAGLDAAADRCDFSCIQAKSASNIGEIVLQDTDYFVKFLQDIYASDMAYFLKELCCVTSCKPINLVSKDPLEVDGWGSPRRQIWGAIMVAVGQKLCENGGWWEKNAKRIKKERMHVKEIKKVIES